MELIAEFLRCNGFGKDTVGRLRMRGNKGMIVCMFIVDVYSLIFWMSRSGLVWFLLIVY